MVRRKSKVAFKRLIQLSLLVLELDTQSPSVFIAS